MYKSRETFKTYHGKAASVKTNVFLDKNRATYCALHSWLGNVCMTKYVKLAEIQIQDLNARSGGKASDAFSESDKSAQIIPSFVYIGALSLAVIVILLFLFKKALELSDYVNNLRKLRRYEFKGVVQEKIEYGCESRDGGNDLTLATQSYMMIVGSRDKKKNYEVKGLSIASFKLPDFVRVLVQTTEGFYVPGNNDIELCANPAADPCPAERLPMPHSYDQSNTPREFLVYSTIAFSLALVAFEYAIMYSGHGYFLRSDTSVTWYSRYIVMGVSSTLLVYITTTLGTHDFAHRVVQISGFFNLLIYAFLAASAGVYYESQTLFFVPACVFLIALYSVIYFNFWDVLLNLNGGSTMSNWIPKKNIWYLCAGFALQVTYLVVVALSTDLYGVISATATYWTLGAFEIAVLLFYAVTAWQAVERKELHQANLALLMCGLRGNYKEALTHDDYAITLSQKSAGSGEANGGNAQSSRQKASSGVLSAANLSPSVSGVPGPSKPLYAAKNNSTINHAVPENVQMRQRITAAAAAHKANSQIPEDAAAGQSIAQKLRVAVSNSPGNGK